MKKGFIAVAMMAATALIGFSANLHSNSDKRYWAHIKAKDKFERSMIAMSGASIERVIDDSVYVIADRESFDLLKAKHKVIESFELSVDMFDFPAEDSRFHNYQELVDELNVLHSQAPDITQLESIGESNEGRKIYRLSLSENLTSKDLPAIVFMGGHHAREHLSVDIPLKFIQLLLEKYKSGDEQVRRLFATRQIHFIPMVNPDGAEYDLREDRYWMWRKNTRGNKDGSRGVDLNRNYGFQWGTGGSSKRPSSDVYMGPEPFSEPETRAIRDFVNANDTQLTTLVSFHTFSELILYPWGHSFDPISNDSAFRVHKRMAETMAAWNGYKPEQSSDLYIASGDTTDWSYGEKGIISFTFELDPSSMWDGGFYPGESRIDMAFNKNIKPVMYLIENADNPYKVLNSDSAF